MKWGFRWVQRTWRFFERRLGIQLTKKERKKTPEEVFAEIDELFLGVDDVSFFRPDQPVTFGNVGTARKPVTFWHMVVGTASVLLSLNLERTATVALKNSYESTRHLPANEVCKEGLCGQGLGGSGGMQFLAWAMGPLRG